MMKLNLRQIMKMKKVRVAWKKMNVILMPGDSIVVKESPGTVNVTVYNPGLIEFKDGDRLQYYIDAAGGLTNRANKEGNNCFISNGVVGAIQVVQIA